MMDPVYRNNMTCLLIPIGEEIARLCDKINRLRAAIERIDAINDNPSQFSAEINEVCDAILRPHLYQQRPDR